MLPQEHTLHKEVIALFLHAGQGHAGTTIYSIEKTCFFQLFSVVLVLATLKKKLKKTKKLEKKRIWQVDIFYGKVLVFELFQLFWFWLLK